MIMMSIVLENAGEVGLCFQLAECGIVIHESCTSSAEPGFHKPGLHQSALCSRWQKHYYTFGLADGYI